MKRARPHAFIRSLHRRLDELVGLIRQQAALEGEPIPCRAGCSWCCAEPVYAMRLEAELAADLVREMPPEQRARVEQRLRDVVTVFAASPLIRAKEPDAIAYRRLRIPCPLLSSDGRCSIYADRPAGCRMHLARKPAEPFCAQDAERRRQEFVVTEHLIAPSIATVIHKDEARYDHFILLLHRALFGRAPKSAAYEHVRWATPRQ
jgi:Fe-S-cluster containining protein